LDYLRAYLEFVGDRPRSPGDFAGFFENESSVTRRDRRRSLVRKGFLTVDKDGDYLLTPKGRTVLAELKQNKKSSQSNFPSIPRFQSSFKENGSINEEKARTAVIRFLKEHGPTSAKVIARFVGLSEAWALHKFPIWAAAGFMKHNGKDRSASRYFVESSREMDIPELQAVDENRQIQSLIQRQEPQIPEVKEPFWWLPFNGSFLLVKERTTVGVVSEEDWMAYAPIEAAGKAKNAEDGMRIVSILSGAQ
jgi:hypothetical protein